MMCLNKVKIVFNIVSYYMLHNNSARPLMHACSSALNCGTHDLEQEPKTTPF